MSHGYKNLADSLEDGPLCPRQVLQVTLQCLDKDPTAAFTSSSVWWDETSGRVSSVQPSKTTQNIGVFMWHLSTARPYSGPEADLEQHAPQPFPRELAQLISNLIQRPPAEPAHTVKRLRQTLEDILSALAQESEEGSVHAERLSTQELWVANKDLPGSRAAGQPVFFIIGGLVTAIVLSILGSLGLTTPAQPESESGEPVQTHQPSERSSEPSGP
jgi:hypothetical protein